jgi:hypothetical protein
MPGTAAAYPELREITELMLELSSYPAAAAGPMTNATAARGGSR